MSSHLPAGAPPLERVRFPVLSAALVFTVAFCAVTAALAQALFSIDVVYLEALAKDSRSAYQQQAQTLLPLRRRGNLLLVTLVLIGTGAQELTALLADALLSGGTGKSLLLSTVLVFVFGNILPVVYALQPAYGLRFAAGCARLVRLILILFYPVAFPMAWVLDKAVGKSVLGVRALNRNELSSLLQFMEEHRMGDLGREESAMLQATLNLHERTAGDVMTAAADVYMLSLDQVLDSKLALELVHQGHSRVPLYDGVRDHIVAYLLVKGLIAYSPSERLTVRDVILRYADRCVIATAPLEVSRSTSLEVLLAEFQRGHSHMAIVYERPHCKKPRQRHFLGIVTLEDIIEDVLKQEIVDESDVYYDMQSKRPVTRAHPERFLTAEGGGTGPSTGTVANDLPAVTGKASTAAYGTSLARVVTSDQTIPRRSIDLARSTTVSTLTASSYRGHGASEMLSNRAVLGMRIPLSRLRGTGYIAIREIDLKKLVPRAQRLRRKDAAGTSQRKAKTLQSDESDAAAGRDSAALDRPSRTEAASPIACITPLVVARSQGSTSGPCPASKGSSDEETQSSKTVEQKSLNATPPSFYGTMEEVGTCLYTSTVAKEARTCRRPNDIDRDSQATTSAGDTSSSDHDEEEDDSLPIRRSHSAYCLRMPQSRSSSPDLEAAVAHPADETQEKSTSTTATSRIRIKFWRSGATKASLKTDSEERAGSAPDTTACPENVEGARSRAADRTLLRRWLLSVRLAKPTTE
jgi:CBS domain containing-hemolysin-like protein